MVKLFTQQVWFQLESQLPLTAKVHGSILASQVIIGFQRHWPLGQAHAENVLEGS